MKTNSKAQISAEKTMKAAKQHSRRGVLKNAALLGSVAAMGPWVVENAFSSSGHLNIMMWSDYLPKSFREKFKAKTGITIKHTPYGSNEELLNKLKATKGRGFDLISPTNDRGGQWQDLGLLGTIDMNRVDTSAILPSMMNISSKFSWDGKPRHLPFIWGTEALAYRTDKFTTDYGKLSYGDLWIPEMKGKIMGRPHSMMAGIGRYLEGKGDLPPFTEAYESEEKMRKIWDKITKLAVEHKPWIKQFWNDADGQINGFMQNGVVLGQTWDGPPLRLFKENKPVRFMAPKEGAFTWLDGLAIPLGAKNIDAIYEFVNFANDPEISGLIANETGYNTVSTGAADYLTEDSKKAFASAYPGDALDKLWPWPATPSWYAEIRNQYRDKFVAA
ncbi:MAG: extracellular solute-binding protein [Sneathiella sp.]|nr:extracellular solute-binding protein [Sneathiella sp.]